VEWASGAHLGILLLLALLIGGVALALRSRQLIAMAVLAVVGLVHGINVGGYSLLWLPQSWGRWSDLWVSMGVFILPASFAWQGRELLTRGSPWRRTDRALLALTWVPLLAMASLPLGHFTEWASLSVAIPWVAAMLCTMAAWRTLWREGWSIVGVMMAVPYTLHSLLGLQVAAAYSGLIPAPMGIEFMWQVEALLLFILTAIALGLDLVRKFQESVARQAQLVASLAQSEQKLDDRVRQRTAELLHTQNALQAALHSERDMRRDQRQFFDMVSHEFRTPLTVIDSAATEQLSFPTDDAEGQVARAAQIRRACRRLTTLMENCLVSERLEGAGFRLQLATVLTQDVVQDAAQLVHWSPHHSLALRLDGAPRQWTCDPTLARIALSNLADNAVKYAPAGRITITARLAPQGVLQVSVANAGAALSPEALGRIFDLFERGNHSDETRGFGLGLWVARRVARLHGGDITVESRPGQGTCFTLSLPPQRQDDANTG
jgi:signal transduction histidine kinase